MSEEILKKLAGIFSNQQKILKKLAQEVAPADELDAEFRPSNVSLDFPTEESGELEDPEQRSIPNDEGSKEFMRQKIKHMQAALQERGLPPEQIKGIILKYLRKKGYW